MDVFAPEGGGSEGFVTDEGDRKARVLLHPVERERAVHPRRGSFRRSFDDYGRADHGIALLIDDGSRQIAGLSNSPAACERNRKHRYHCCKSQFQ